ncbi:ribonuclease H-like domain-containing protein [Tanacetum coccineum]
MNQFYGMKGIKREFSVVRTPQQNRVVERNNRTLIEAARTMLSYSLLPTTFWAEAVSTACYVQNRVLVTKPHNKTPYELLHGRPPSISFMRPFGCPVTILNTLDPLGKFDGKADEGFFVGYSINSKDFRVFNTRTRKVEENLHITFLENKPNVAGSGPDWLFDIDLLTNSMNYEPVTTGNQTNKNAGIKDNTQQYILLPLLYDSPQSSEDAVADDAGKKTNEEPANEGERNGQEKEGGASNKEDDQNVQDFRAELDNLLVQQKEGYANSTNRDSTVSPSVSTAGQNFTNADDLPTDPLMPDLEDTANLLNTGIFSGAYDDEDVGAEADLNNLETTMNVSPIPTTRIHKDHPKDQIIGDINSATQTRRMTKISEEHAMVSYIKKQRRTNHKDYQNCLFACFLYSAFFSQIRYAKIERFSRLVIYLKERLVAQGYTQEEGIEYDKVFAHVARIEAVSKKSKHSIDEPTRHMLKDEEAKEVDVHAKKGITNFALMAYTSQGSLSSSSSDFEVRKTTDQALKEKDDLKLKLENFEESSKNLTKLINSQISAKDKTGLGYDSQMNESEVVYSVFNSRESDVDDSPINDRFKIGKGFHAVPPPYIGNYMPLRPDLSFAGLDDSVYKTKVSET